MLNKIARLINVHKLFIVISLIFFFIQYWYFYKSGSVVLGGEGNYWLDFNIYLKKFAYTWVNNHTGSQSTAPSNAFLFPFLLSFIKNLSIQSYLISLLIYYLPFLSMYFLLFKIQRHSFLSLLVAIFYVFNPYSVFINESQIMWSSSILSLFPILMLIMLLFQKNKLKLFFYFGVASFIFSYSLVNPPLLILVMSSFPILLIITHLLKFKKILFKKYVLEVIIVYTSFFLFNASWLLSWAMVLPYAETVYNLEIANNWLNTVSVNSQFIFKEIFSFSWLTPKMDNNNFLSSYYEFPIIKQILFIPFLLLVYFLLKNKFKDRVFLIIFGFLLILILFLKSTNPPFKYFLTTCFNYVPFCYVFKTAPEKIGYLFVFLFSIVLYLILVNFKNKNIIYVFYLYIIILSIPVITGKYLPDKQILVDKYSTKKYIEPIDFTEFREEMIGKKLEARTLSLPTYRNYNVLLNLYDNKYFLGVDPLLQNSPQSFIASYSMEGSKNYVFPLDSNYKKNVLSIYSIRYLSYNTALTPWIGTVTDQEMENELEFTTNNFKLLRDFGKIKLYENDSFLPKIYVPQEVIVTNRSMFDFFNSLQESIKEKRLVIFFENQNTKVSQVKQLSSSVKEFSNSPVIEFKKINATKYRVRVHRASNDFYLVFSDKFSEFWKLYLNGINNYDKESDGGFFQDYKVNEFDALDQVSGEEITEYLNNFWLTSKYFGNYISKNFSGSIQNDNLQNGLIYETWFKSPVIATQLMANSYSNSWFINTKDICDNSIKCTQNKDNSYDFELVLEFWPQRIYYLGCLISIVTLGGVGSLLYFYLKRKKYEVK